MTAIRRVTPAEAGAITDLGFRSKAYWGYSPEFMEACREDMTITPEFIASHPVFALEEQGRIMGFYGLLPRTVDLVVLDFLYVDPDAIGRGYGRQLWAHLTETARSLGFRRMEISADPNAEPFYVAMGARRIGETPSTAIPGRMLPLMGVDL